MTDLKIASFNLLNLRLAGRPFYSNPGYSAQQSKKKTAWTAQMFDRLNCQLIGVQEVFDEQALQDCVKSSRRMRAASYAGAPRAIGNNKLPRVGLISNLPLLAKVKSTSAIPKEIAVTLPGAPEIGIDAYSHQQFSRPVLSTTVELGTARKSIPARVYVIHLKSRRPKLLSAGRGKSHVAEDLTNPAIETRAHLRALMMRAAESSGLRLLLLRDLVKSRMPVIVLGDFNDHVKAMTTELVTGRMLARQRDRRDFMLWHASALQRPNVLKRDVGYTKIYFGEPDSIDHILFSEEFLRDGKNAVAEVMRVDYFNDHLNDRDPAFSDHGAIRASLRLL